MGNKRTKERARVQTGETSVNWSRLRQIFSNLSHRGTRIFKGFAFGPVVEASSPAEADKATDEKFVEVTGETKN